MLNNKKKKRMKLKPQGKSNNSDDMFLVLRALEKKLLRVKHTVIDESD